MLHSLRVRLLLTLIGVVLVAVATLAVFTNWSTTTEFRDYVAQDSLRTGRIMETLLQAAPGPQDPRALNDLAHQLADASGDRILIADGGGTVLADSGGDLIGKALPWSLPLPIAGGSVVGPKGIPGDVLVNQTFSMPVTPGDPASVPTFIQLAVPGPGISVGAASAASSSLVIVRVPTVQSAAVRFLQTASRSLLLAVLAAGIVAVLLTLLLSRRILGPVEALTAAARRMEKGDLTHRVRVQSPDEIGELAHAFNAMADGLTRLERGRRRLISDVAHELRTPLTNLRGYLEALEDGVVQPTPAIIRALHEEALLLGRLVDDLQELSLAESGHLRLARQPVAFAALITQAVQALQPVAADKGVTVTADLAPDLPLVSADPGRIGQVVRNLLDNALRHTPAGGRITVAARLRDAEIAVEVRDTGSGIAPADLPHIFERFYRADQARARATGGAGLGLAIVRQLVTLHGGRVWADSPPGAGATVTFTLPLPTRAPGSTPRTYAATDAPRSAVAKSSP
jgi:signal transduction histidine kinase